MSEIGAGYYRGQDSHISVGDIVAIVVSVTFGLPLVVCLIYCLYIWARACYYYEDMKRDGQLGEGVFWCWKSSSQVDLNVDELVDAVPPVSTNGLALQSGAGQSSGATRSGSSTPTESDPGVELTTNRPAPLLTDGRAPQQHEAVVIEVS